MPKKRASWKSTHKGYKGTCANCGKMFSPKSSSQRFCTTKCAAGRRKTEATHRKEARHGRTPSFD